MTSERLPFHPHEVSTTHTGAGSEISGLQDRTSPQQVVVHRTLEVPQNLLSIKTDLLSENNLLSTAFLSAGNSAQGKSQPAPILNTSPSSGVDPSFLPDAWAEVRKRRREQWEQKGYVPPIAGGSPLCKTDLPLNLVWQPGSYFASDEHGSGASDESSEKNQPLSEERALTWEERLSKDGFWVFDYLQGIGYTKHLRELAEMEGIDFNTGLEELRRQGLLDESNPDYPTINWPVE